MAGSIPVRYPMSKETKFIIDFLSGDAEASDIDEYVNSIPPDDTADTIRTYETLGLTYTEYLIYVENPWKFKRYLHHLREEFGEDYYMEISEEDII